MAVLWHDCLEFAHWIFLVLGDGALVAQQVETLWAAAAGSLFWMDLLPVQFLLDGCGSLVVAGWLPLNCLQRVHTALLHPLPALVEVVGNESAEHAGHLYFALKGFEHAGHPYLYLQDMLRAVLAEAAFVRSDPLQ